MIAQESRLRESRDQGGPSQQMNEGGVAKESPDRVSGCSFGATAGGTDVTLQFVPDVARNAAAFGDVVSTQRTASSAT